MMGSARGLFWIVVLAAVVSGACGAGDLDAPELEEARQASCDGLSTLMPAFLRAINTGKTESLRRVVETELLASRTPEEPPEVMHLVRAFLTAVGQFADSPREDGAPPGKICADPPPPLSASHPICELRRMFDNLIHDAKGTEALKLGGPLVGLFLTYMAGRAPGSDQPHYEVASVVGHLCLGNATCRIEDWLDLIIGLNTFLQTPDGAAALDHLGALVTEPALRPYIEDDGQTYGGEKGIVAFANVIAGSVAAMSDPSELDKIPVAALPKDARPIASDALLDLKKLLDPKRQPNVLTPMKRVLKCHAAQDPNDEIVRMLYRLYRTQRNEFDPANLVRVFRGLREIDRRGSLLHLLNVFARAFREDEEAVRSFASVCSTFFSTTRRPEQARSNAEMVIPVLADLFAEEVASEFICAADTLFYGCAGGARPACPSP